MNFLLTNWTPTVSNPSGKQKGMVFMDDAKGLVKSNGNNTNYQFRQQHNHPVELEGDCIEQKLNYIHNNPVDAGFVDEPHQWRLSSANSNSPIKVLGI